MKRKKIKIVIIALLALCAIGLGLLFAINAYVKSASRGRILSIEDSATLDADCIIVLGAGVYPSGNPSPMLEDRLSFGIDLYNSGAANKLIMSGDHGRAEYDEVNVMKSWAVEKGVPSEDVFMDHAGFSTYESLFRARDIFLAKRVVIVTQKYHMFRALYIAKRLGLDAYGVCSDPRQYAGQTYRDIRELAARVKDFFQCVIMPEPTFLGDVISVFGNGDVTND